MGGRVLVETVHALRIEFIPKEPDHAIVSDLIVPGGVPGVQAQCGSPGQKLQKAGAQKRRQQDQEPEEHLRGPDPVMSGRGSGSGC